MERQLFKLGLSSLYLFGSRAKNIAGPMSDYDFAVLLKENINAKNYFDLKLQFINILCKNFKTDKIDAVILNECPVILAMNVIEHGKIIVEKDKDYRVAFENYTTKRYLDRLPYEKRYIEYMVKRYA